MRNKLEIEKRFDSLLKQQRNQQIRNEQYKSGCRNTLEWVLEDSQEHFDLPAYYKNRKFIKPGDLIEINLGYKVLKGLVYGEIGFTKFKPHKSDYWEYYKQIDGMPDITAEQIKKLKHEKFDTKYGYYNSAKDSEIDKINIMFAEFLGDTVKENEKGILCRYLLGSHIGVPWENNGYNTFNSGWNYLSGVFNKVYNDILNKSSKGMNTDEVWHEIFKNSISKWEEKYLKGKELPFSYFYYALGKYVISYNKENLERIK